jgi:hypothetical protein
MTQQRSDRRERTWLEEATHTETRTTGSRKQVLRTAEVEKMSRDAGRLQVWRRGLGKDFGGAQMPGGSRVWSRSKVTGLMTGGHACACMHSMGPGWCADQGWKRIVESSSPDACCAHELR